jgi:hypothetical protein
MALWFYLKKVFVDQEPNIEHVNIHYTWTPRGYPPDWAAHRETRAMPRGGVYFRGMGGLAADASGAAQAGAAERVEVADDGVRRKILRLPNSLAENGSTHEHYTLHHYFEVFRHGRACNTQLYSEDIVTKEIEYIDYVGNVGGMCIYWSIGDWDAPQYTPTEEQNFVAWYGEDNPYRSHKLYASEDKNTFIQRRHELLSALPMPRRYVEKIRGPRGAMAHQGWHTGGLRTAGPSWEEYFGWYEHTFQ